MKKKTNPANNSIASKIKAEKFTEALEKTLHFLKCLFSRIYEMISAKIKRLFHPEERLNDMEAPLLEAIEKILTEPNAHIYTPNENRMYIVTKKSLVKLINNKITIVRNTTTIDVECTPLFESCFKKTVFKALDKVIKSFDIDISSRIVDFNEQI